MIKLNFTPFILLLAVLVYSCSASTDTRYSKDSEKEVHTEKEKEYETVIEDDFDINPYRTKIELPAVDKNPEEKPADLWFEYPINNDEDITKKTIADTVAGYRVQVISTDNLEEANSVRSDLYFKTNEKAVYILFEPPFYIVRIGDYKNFNDAKALSFKLNQMGFAGTKVVNDLINIYK